MHATLPPIAETDYLSDLNTMQLNARRYEALRKAFCDEFFPDPNSTPEKFDDAADKILNSTNR